jgi:hypothetical protein
LKLLSVSERSTHAVSDAGTEMRNEARIHGRSFSVAALSSHTVFQSRSKSQDEEKTAGADTIQSEPWIARVAQQFESETDTSQSEDASDALEETTAAKRTCRALRFFLETHVDMKAPELKLTEIVNADFIERAGRDMDLREYITQVSVTLAAYVKNRKEGIADEESSKRVRIAVAKYPLRNKILWQRRVT